MVRLAATRLLGIQALLAICTYAQSTTESDTVTDTQTTALPTSESDTQTWTFARSGATDDSSTQTTRSVVSLEELETPTPIHTILTGTNLPHTEVPHNGTGNGTIPTSTSDAPPLPKNTQPCNKHVEFCDRSYGKITYVGAHNSPFVRPNSAAANQNLDVIAQLNDGIRMLQGQVHKENDTMYYCHTSCDLLNAGPMEDYLKTVVQWLDENPFEIITILIGNGDYSPIEDFVPAIEASRLDHYAYVPENRSINFDEWPTLSEMIFMGKRAVVFVDYEAKEDKVPYLLDEFTYMWETPFSQTDPAFPCDRQRPPDKEGMDDKLYMANHNLGVEFNIGMQSGILVPNIVQINQTNAEEGFGSLGLHAETCKKQWNRYPNFLLVDFYEAGNGSVFQVAAKANNVTYDWNCCGKVASAADARFSVNYGVLWPHAVMLAVMMSM